jgi:hypothetical protein
MKTTKRTLPHLIGWLLGVMALASLCPTKAGEALRQQTAVLGKWQDTGSTETIEFFKNGTVTYVYKGRDINGTYEVVGMERGVEQDKNQFVGFGEIRVQFNTLGAPALVGKVSGSGDELVLTPTPANGALPAKFKKAK